MPLFQFNLIQNMVEVHDWVINLDVLLLIASSLNRKDFSVTPTAPIV